MTRARRSATIEGVDTDASSLPAELEDAGGTSWWKGLLATLSSQFGNAYNRFVRTCGRRGPVGVGVVVA
jgi:hypothetical protein